jgi:Adenylate cyclase associated (CAP) C terminal
MKEEDDMLELPIPEQFETRVLSNGTLVTRPVEHI